jgi:hypothetical protein
MFFLPAERFWQHEFFVQSVTNIRLFSGSEQDVVGLFPRYTKTCSVCEKNHTKRKVFFRTTSLVTSIAGASWILAGASSSLPGALLCLAGACSITGALLEVKSFGHL